MSNPYSIVAVRFKEPHRGSMDISNALDMAEFPADVDDIDHTVEQAVNILEYYAEKHSDSEARSLASKLRAYLTEDSLE